MTFVGPSPYIIICFSPNAYSPSAIHRLSFLPHSVIMGLGSQPPLKHFGVFQNDIIVLVAVGMVSEENVHQR